MTNTIKLFLVLAIVSFVGTSCKSKQKVAKISGANVTAVESVPVTTSTTSTTSSTSSPVSSESEVTRNESFSFSDGDSDAMNSKYHVVVGSFKSQSNAKGLKETLNSEGNRAIVVINEQSMYRVIIASYNEYSQARSKINGINNRFADAWVLVQKK